MEAVARLIFKRTFFWLPWESSVPNEVSFGEMVVHFDFANGLVVVIKDGQRKNIATFERSDLCDAIRSFNGLVKGGNFEVIVVKSSLFGHARIRCSLLGESDQAREFEVKILRGKSFQFGHVVTCNYVGPFDEHLLVTYEPLFFEFAMVVSAVLLKRLVDLNTFSS